MLSFTLWVSSSASELSCGLPSHQLQQVCMGWHWMPRNLLRNQEEWNRHVHHFPSYVEQSWLPLDEVLASKMTEDWYSWDSSSFPDLTIPRRFLARGARIHLATSILMECWAWVCRPWHWVTLTMLHPRDEMGRETDELISVQNLFSTVNNFSRVCWCMFCMFCHGLLVICVLV